MELAQEVLAAPEGLRYVARSLLEEPTDLHGWPARRAANMADEPVGTLLHSPAVVCAPDTTIREAAQRMSDGRRQRGRDSTSRAGGLGILTDRDLRMRVVAAGLSGDAPVSVAMSAPAYTCAAERPAGDVLLEMLDRGCATSRSCRRRGELLGVIEDMDLVAARTRSSFYLRRRIAAPSSPSSSPRVARELAPMVVALHEARVAAANVMAVYAVCVDALTRRLLELVGRRGGPRRRRVRVAGDGQPGAPRGAAQLRPGLGDRVVRRGRRRGRVRERLVGSGARCWTGCAPCGLRLDEHGVNASAPAFVRSVASWQREARSWIDDPTQEKALMLSSVVVDSRPVWGVHTGTPVADTFALAPDHPALLRLLARFALSDRPPTGFLRGLVVEHSGEHRGRTRSQAGRDDPDRRPRPLGGHGGGGDQRLDRRAPAGGQRRRQRSPPPSRTTCPMRSS